MQAHRRVNGAAGQGVRRRRRGEQRHKGTQLNYFHHVHHDTQTGVMHTPDGSPGRKGPSEHITKPTEQWGKGQSGDEKHNRAHISSVTQINYFFARICAASRNQAPCLLLMGGRACGHTAERMEQQDKGCTCTSTRNNYFFAKNMRHVIQSGAVFSPDRRWAINSHLKTSHKLWNNRTRGAQARKDITVYMQLQATKSTISSPA
jgi:hypothetical protein